MRALDIDVVKNLDERQSTMRRRRVPLIDFSGGQAPAFSGLPYEIQKDSDSHAAGLCKKDITRALV
jgi:hypothetical protein